MLLLIKGEHSQIGLRKSFILITLNALLKTFTRKEKDKNREIYKSQGQEHLRITKKPTSKIKETILLTYDFFLIGLFTIGGGYAMIPQMRQTFCKSRKYLTEEEFWEILAISQITPGPIAINMATFIGYRVNGFLGSLFATIGVILPSFIVILLISIFFINFFQISPVKKFLIGILAGVVGEITYIILEILKKSGGNIFYLSIMFLSLVELLVLRVNPILVILIGGFLGIILGKWFEDKNGSS